jgi:hypothetical protein
LGFSRERLPQASGSTLEAAQHTPKRVGRTAQGDCHGGRLAQLDAREQLAGDGPDDERAVARRRCGYQEFEFMIKVA